MGKSSFGAEFWFDSEAGTLVMCGEVTRLKPPSTSAAGIDTTSHASPGGVQQQIPSGVKSLTAGTVDLQIAPGSAEDVMLAAASAGARVGTYKFVLPGATDPQGYSGEGWIVYEVGDATPDGKLTATVTVNPTGAFTQDDES